MVPLKIVQKVSKLSECADCQGWGWEAGECRKVFSAMSSVFQITAVAFSTFLNLSSEMLIRHGLLGLCNARRGIAFHPGSAEAKVAERKRPADLPVIVMVFRDNAPGPPPPARAPSHRAGRAGYAAEFQRPRAVGLIRAISLMGLH